MAKHVISRVTDEDKEYLQALEDAESFSMLIDKLESSSEDGILITKEEAAVLLYQLLES